MCKEKPDSFELTHLLRMSYRSVEAIKRYANESMKDFVEKVANQFQELMNEEISSRMVNSG